MLSGKTVWDCVFGCHCIHLTSFLELESIIGQESLLVAYSAVYGESKGVFYCTSMDLSLNSSASFLSPIVLRLTSQPMYYSNGRYVVFI